MFPPSEPERAILGDGGTTVNRCIDLELGQKVLSYDLLGPLERHELDQHLEKCAACRDFRQQSLGKEGAFDDLALRVFRLSQRQRVEPHAWMMNRLRDLWLPLLLILGVVGVVTVWLAQRGPDVATVHVLHWAVTRGATLDSVATPHVEPVPDGMFLRTDRSARAYVYETREGTLRRLLPPEGGDPTEVGPAELSELRLPKLESKQSRLLLVLVPSGAAGTVTEWDDAVFRQLRGGKNPQVASRGAWPGGTTPTFRWYP